MFLELKDGIDKTKEVLKATGTQIGITVTRVILPAFEAFAEKLESVLAWVRSLDERTIKMTLTIAGIVAAIASSTTVACESSKSHPSDLPFVWCLDFTHWPSDYGCCRVGDSRDITRAKTGKKSKRPC